MHVGDPMKLLEPRVRPWARQEYYDAAERGWFQGQRVQLIKGEVIQMPPMGHGHVVAVWRTRTALEKLFASEHWVRQESPLSLAGDSEPEPDVAVVRGGPDDYTDHPTTAVLVVEVADTTLRLDRRLAGLCASAGIPEYWIVDLRHQRLEVCREPVADEAEEFGYRYGKRQTLERDEEVSPVARPEARIGVAEMLG